jgi:ABC-type protease/lipase transport system fused ATPase/permease subunit
MTGTNRLLKLWHENNEAGARMALQAPRFLQLAQRHELGTAPRAITAFNLFQTPPDVAAKMAAIVRAGVSEGARVLEPSVGLGRLYAPFEDWKAQWVMVENAMECVRAVRNALNHAVIESDFLQLSASDLGGKFDAVIMNPPFKQGTDVKHIMHAFNMLRPGGLLVSLCYNGTKQNENLRPIADTWEVLPDGSFKREGTSASVAMLTMRK